LLEDAFHACSLSVLLTDNTAAYETGLPGNRLSPDAGLTDDQSISPTLVTSMEPLWSPVVATGGNQRQIE
jgi:hypothetical protein